MAPELPSIPEPTAGAVCVAPGGDDAAKGTPDAPVATIQRALALGKPIILVAGGRYSGLFGVGQPVSIFGGLDSASWRRAGPPSVFDGNASQSASEVRLASPGVLLDGLHVLADAKRSLHAVTVQSGSARLSRCTLQGSNRSNGGALSCWAQTHVRQCEIHSGPGAEATGVSAHGGGSIVDCDIEGHHIGVNCSTLTLEGNRIHAGMYGVYIQGEDVVLRRNTITVNPLTRSSTGVFCVHDERVTLEANTINGQPDTEILGRWSQLPRRSWQYDETASNDYFEISITGNGLWYHGEAAGPSGGPFSGPTQTCSDFLENEPVRTVPAELVAEIRAFLRAHLPR